MLFKRFWSRPGEHLEKLGIQVNTLDRYSRKRVLRAFTKQPFIGTRTQTPCINPCRGFSSVPIPHDNPGISDVTLLIKILHARIWLVWSHLHANRELFFDETLIFLVQEGNWIGRSLHPGKNQLFLCWPLRKLTIVSNTRGASSHTHLGDLVFFHLSLDLIIAVYLVLFIQISSLLAAYFAKPYCWLLLFLLLCSDSVCRCFCLRMVGVDPYFP